MVHWAVIMMCNNSGMIARGNLKDVVRSQSGYLCMPNCVLGVGMRSVLYIKTGAVRAGYAIHEPFIDPSSCIHEITSTELICENAASDTRKLN